MAVPLPLPALYATHAGIWIARGDGEVREASRGEAIARAAETPHIILNAPLIGQRLGYPELSGLDLLELFAFIHPARFAVPTVAGLCRAVGLEPPDGEPGSAGALRMIAERLLAVLADPEWREREGAWTSNAQVAVKMAVGELTLRLPRRLGVRIGLDKFLSSFEPAGLVRRGNAFVTPGYDRAERKVDIDVTTAVGGVRVEWGDDVRPSAVE